LLNTDRVTVIRNSYRNSEILFVRALDADSGVSVDIIYYFAINYGAMFGISFNGYHRES